MQQGKVYIANDHGGFRLKSKIVEYLSERGVPFENLGCDSTDIVRYPYYAADVAERVRNEEGARGILICSTGIGMSIIANRFPGIRAALCTSSYMAKMTRLHNDSNLLCLGGQITGEMEALDILDTWLNTGFEGGRHCISLGLIETAELELQHNGVWTPKGDRL